MEFWVYWKNGKPFMSPVLKKIYLHSEKPTNIALNAYRNNQKDHKITVKKIKIIELKNDKQ